MNVRAQRWRCSCSLTQYPRFKGQIWRDTLPPHLREGSLIFSHLEKCRRPQGCHCRDDSVIRYESSWRRCIHFNTTVVLRNQNTQHRNTMTETPQCIQVCLFRDTWLCKWNISIMASGVKLVFSIFHWTWCQSHQSFCSKHLLWDDFFTGMACQNSSAKQSKMCLWPLSVWLCCVTFQYFVETKSFLATVSIVLLYIGTDTTPTPTT